MKTLLRTLEKAPIQSELIRIGPDFQNQNLNWHLCFQELDLLLSQFDLHVEPELWYFQFSELEPKVLGKDNEPPKTSFSLG